MSNVRHNIVQYLISIVFKWVAESTHEVICFIADLIHLTNFFIERFFHYWTNSIYTALKKTLGKMRFWTISGLVFNDNCKLYISLKGHQAGMLFLSNSDS